MRLSQERPTHAKDAAFKGWSLWRDLGPGNFPSRFTPSILTCSLSLFVLDSPSYPSASSRLSLAQVLLELSLHVEALEILQRLENEDDEDPEVWYLSGWAWWLLGETRSIETVVDAEEENQGECWSEGKLCLDNYLRVSLLFYCFTINADFPSLSLF